MATDSRVIWITTLSGVPKGLTFGTVKYHSGAPSPANYHAALGSAETSGAGWDAVPTNWERPPPLAVDIDATTSPTLVDDVLTVAGVEYDVNELGDPHPQRNTRCCPDGKIVDNTALVVFIEALGNDVSFVERGTKKRVTVYTTEPGDPTPGRVDSGIYRETVGSAVVRSDS